jgi:hypothetical protein
MTTHLNAFFTFAATATLYITQSALQQWQSWDGKEWRLTKRSLFINICYPVCIHLWLLLEPEPTPKKSL